MFLLTFKDSLNELLKNGSFYIALGIAAIIFVVLLVLLIKSKKKN